MHCCNILTTGMPDMSVPGLDKLLHFAISYLIATVDPTLALLAGIGKEIFDFLGGGTADLLDLAADALGILAAL